MGTVSINSIISMFFSGAISIIIPIGLIIYLGVKKKLNIKAALLGAGFFILFVLILEKLLHFFVLGMNPKDSFIFNNTILFMLYGGLAAGIFEETARFIGFKFIFKVDKNTDISTGLSYGVGHGGIEALIIGGLAAINNIAYSFMINNGTINTITNALPEAQREVIQTVIDSLVNTQSYLFAISGIERLFALVIQISLSVIVFKAVSQRKFILFPVAILLHAVVDFVAVLAQKGVISNFVVVEAIIGVFAIGIAFIAYRVVKSEIL